MKMKLSILVFALTVSVLSVSASEEETKSTLMEQGFILDGDYFHVSSVFGSDYDPLSIQSITFLDTLTNMPSDAWDVSEEQDGSIMAWAVSADSGFYDLYIAGDDCVINAPVNSSYFFAYPNVTSIEFNDCFSTDNVINMDNMFNSCHLLKEIDLSSFDTSQVTDMNDMFYGCSSLEKLDFSSFDTSQVMDMSGLFLECESLEELDLSGFDTPQLQSTLAMFSGCSSLEKLDISKLNTSKVENMNSMFRNCKSLKELNVSSFDTSSAWGMCYMFYECNSLENLDVSGFNTSNVEDMSYMFYGCNSLENLDLSNFETFYTTNMAWMFYGCSSLNELDISGFETFEVKNMRSMFSDCTSLKQLDLDGFDTSNVSDMSDMFKNCRSLEELDVSGFDTSNVSNMSDMFDGCSSLKELDLSSWDMSKVPRSADISGMFDGCSLLVDLVLPDSVLEANSIITTIGELGYSYIGWEEYGVTYRSGEINTDNIGLEEDPPVGVVSCAKEDLDGDGEEELLLVLLEETEREFDTSGKKDSRLAFIICENEEGNWVEAQTLSTVQVYGSTEEDTIATLADIIPDIKIYLAPCEDGMHIIVSNTCEYVFANSIEDTVREKTEIIYSDGSVSGTKCTSEDEDEFKRITWLMDDNDSILISQIYPSFFCGDTSLEEKNTRYEQFLSGADDYVFLILKDFGEFADVGEEIYEENGWARPSYIASEYVILPDYKDITVTDADAYERTEPNIDGIIRELFEERGWEYTGLDSVTDEQAAILSAQKYQTAQEYLDAVRDYYNTINEYGREFSIFADSIWPVIMEGLEFYDYPEDVFEFDVTSMIRQGDHTAGSSINEIYNMLGEDNFSTYAQNILDDLLHEMILKCIAEENNIEGISEEAYMYLMYINNCTYKEDLRNCYNSDSELEQELLLLDIADCLVKQANVEGDEFEETYETQATQGSTFEIMESETVSTYQDQTEAIWNEDNSDISDASSAETKLDYGIWEVYTFDSGNKYSGFVKDGEMSGWGTYTFSNGDFYEGQFEDNLFSGFGIYFSQDGMMYIGEAQEDQMCGLGITLYVDDEYIFMGENDHGLNGLAAVYGEGTLLQMGTFKDSACVEDGFENCLLNDDGSLYYGIDPDDISSGEKGIIMYANGVQIGIYPEGTSGKSLEFLDNGDWYIGQLDDGVFEGEGIYVYDNAEDIEYVMGNFENGEFSEGVMKYDDGTWKIGTFKDNVYVEGSGITSDDVM